MGEKYRDFRFFYEPSDFAKENLIVADGMGYVDSTTFCVDCEFFDNQLLICVLEGNFHVEQYGKSFVLGKGESILMQLRHKQKYYCDSEIGAVIIWFHFRGKEADRVMEQLYRDGRLPMIMENSLLEYKIYECFAIAEKRNEDFEFDISAKIYETLLEISRRCQMEKKGREDTSGFRQKTITYIERNLSAPIELEELASNVNLSKFYFCRQFKECTGESPLKFRRKNGVG